MAIFAGNWIDGAGVPFWGDAVATTAGKTANVARANRLRPNENPTDKRRDVMCRFGDLSRKWKEELTAAQQLTWEAGEGLTDDRRDDVVTPTSIRHWMNAQFPSYWSQLYLQATDDCVQPYIIQDLELLGAYEATQSYTVRLKLSVQGSGNYKSFLHISPVPKPYIETPRLWRYALHSKSHSLWTDKIYPAYDLLTYSAPAIYPLVRYETAQVYIRVTEFKNLWLPASKQDSRTVTYAWAAMTVSVTPPP